MDYVLVWVMRVILGLALDFFTAFWAMFALAAAHSQYHAIPPLGYMAAFWLVFIGTGIVAAGVTAASLGDDA